MTVVYVYYALGDKFKAHGEVLISTMVISTVTNICSLYMTNFNSQLPVVLLTAIFRAPLGPEIDSIVMASLEDKTTYGSLRLWGAVSFGILSLIGGYLTSVPIPLSEDESTQDKAWNGPFFILFYTYALSTILSGFIVLSLYYNDNSSDGSSSGRRSDVDEELNQLEKNKIEDDIIIKQLQKEYISNNNRTANSSSSNSINNQSIENEMVSLHKPYSNQNSNTNHSTTSTSTSSSTINPYQHISTIDYIEQQQLSPTTISTTTSTTPNISETDTTNSDPSHPDTINITLALKQIISDHPSVLIFAIVVFLSGFGQGAIESYLFLYLKELGGKGLVMGIARFITCVAEVPMFHIAGKLQQQYGTWAMITLTQLAFVIRFLYYTLIINPWTVLPCELLNGLTFAVTWSVSCTYANMISPPGCEAVVQALLEGLHFGLGYGSGAVVGGFIYEYYGGIRLFQLCALLSLVSTILALLTWRFCENMHINTTRNQNISIENTSVSEKLSSNSKYIRKKVSKSETAYIQLTQAEENDDDTNI